MEVWTLLDFKPVNKIRYNKHPRRRNNGLVAAMYAMYLKGPDGRSTSLKKIGKIYGKLGKPSMMFSDREDTSFDRSDSMGSRFSTEFSSPGPKEGI